MGRSQRPRPKHLGSKLAQIRSALGLTLEEMVRRLNYSDSPLYPSNIFEFEKNKREPPLMVLVKYGEVAGVCTDVLIRDDLELSVKLPSKPIHKNMARLSKANRNR
jgi:transcriptional regulator with XRE-family HTH domain